ncbi:MAG: hypothetical protein J6A58_14100 [Oscillospiraceae bacterium]|nr:hypothetical protein [Oscillospiraceae bacterium]
MKKIKYIITIIFIMVGFVMTGELYQSYTDNVSNFYETTFYVQPGVEADDMIKDIYDTAKEHKVSVFFIDKFVENSFNTRISVYSDKETKDMLIADYYLREGKSDSFLSGSTEVFFYEYMDVPDRIVNASPPTYYLYGDYNDMVEMKRELVDKYGGSFPKNDDYSSLEEKRTSVIAIWVIIGVIICFLSFYSIAISQREFMVRATMGESFFSMYLKNVFLDTAVIILVYIIEFKILMQFTNVAFLSDISFKAMVIIIFINALVTLKILFLKIREAFNKITGRRELMVGSYIIKVFSCCVVMVLLTFQFATIKEAISYYRQRDFFKEHNNYSYVRIKYRGLYDVHEQFVRYFDDRYLIADPCISFGECDDYSIVNSQTAILMNYKMLEEMKQYIPGVSVSELPEKGCVIVPEGFEISEEGYEQIKRHIIDNDINNDKRNTDSVPIIKYNDKVKIITIEENFINKSEWWKQPVIIAIDYYDWPLLSEEELTDRKREVADIRTYNMMVNATPQEIYDFIEEFDGCEVEVTNVYEYYKYRWTVIKRSMYLSIIVAIMVILLEISINILIVSFEYKFNAVELAVKKILSYSKAERMKHLCVTTGAIIAISTIICFIVIKLLGFDYAYISIISAILVSLLNYLVITLCTERYEKTNIPKILKGGEV